MIVYITNGDEHETLYVGFWYEMVSFTTIEGKIFNRLFERILKISQK